jgi:alanine racemase
MILFIKNNPTLKLKSIFSHLAASDEQNNDNFTREQIQRFDRLSQKIITELKTPIIRHLLNSAGIERHPDGQFDMVRLGIGMYGVSPSQNKQLKNVSTLKTSISQIKKINKEQSIGYSRKGKLQSDGKIAILQIGYADGIRRNLSNGKGKFLVNGKLAPTVGNICMDMCMIDISHIDCKEGDKVIVFGEDYPIQEIAKQMETIPYEVLTGISQRVKRIYYQD